MPYPNTNLTSDVADPPYGGAPANRFGTPARQFIDSVLQLFGQVYLKYIRVPWNTIVCVSGSGNAVGEVCYFDQGQFVSNQGSYFRDKNTGSATAMVVGVWLDAASANGKARVVYGGLISPAITGLGILAANTPVSASASTGKLQAANVGDTVLGYTDINGNVLLLPPARIA